MDGPSKPPKLPPSGPGLPRITAPDPRPTAGLDRNPPAAPVGDALERGGGQGAKGQGAPAEPTARARLGDESLDAAGLSGFSTLLAAEHLMILLAKKRGRLERSAILKGVGDLLLAHERPEQVKRILLALAEVGRIVDIYPLEVMAYCLEQRASILEGVRFGELVRNKTELESARHGTGDPIRLELPLAAKLKAMALEGGGVPGYHLYPGALAEYFIELGEPGRWTVLLRAEMHQELVIDRVTLDLVDR